MPERSPDIMRRKIVAAGAAVFAVSAGLAHAQTTTPAATPSTFVLVHGSWHGGWCYSRVATVLRARGHAVYTPTLTGLAELSHLLSDRVDLDMHIADLANLIDWYDLRDIVLCGHSYGGMPAMGVADKRADRIKSLCLLDAFVPGDGQSLVEVSRQPTPTAPTQPAPPAAAFVMNERDRPWVQSKLTAHPNGTRTQKVRLSGAWTSIAKKSYVRVPGFKLDVFDEMLARFAADPSWRTGRLLDSGHDAMIDQPERLADMLEAAV